MKFRRWASAIVRIRDKSQAETDKASDLRQSLQFHEQPFRMDRLVEHRGSHLAQERMIFGIIGRARKKDKTAAKIRLHPLDGAVKQITFQFRHPEITDNGVHVPAEKLSQCHFPVGGGTDFIIERLKEVLVDRRQLEVVVHDQHALSVRRRLLVHDG